MIEDNQKWNEKKRLSESYHGDFPKTYKNCRFNPKKRGPLLVQQ